jgi:hypothetical protein
MCGTTFKQAGVELLTMKVEVSCVPGRAECTRLSAQSRYTKLSTSGLDSLEGNDVRRGSMLSVCRFGLICSWYRTHAPRHLFLRLPRKPPHGRTELAAVKGAPAPD